jgi:xyloglucan 6-xylosyltransferase
MTEQPVAADRRARQHRLLPLLVLPVFFLFLVAPCALFLFRSSDLALIPRIRIEFDRREALSIAPKNEPRPAEPVPQPSPPPPSPAPAPPAPGADDDEEQRRLPPPRQLTDPPYALGPTVGYDARRAQWLRDNPRFPAFVAPGRPRVLVVTGSSPRRCSDPDGEHLLLRAFKNKADYCRVHGFDIFYSTAVLDAELSGFWSKLPLLRTLMLAHPETELLWWVDSDVIFTDMLFEPPWDKYAGHNLVLPGSEEKVYAVKSWIGINAGSFIIRNCQWSLDLLDALARMGPRGPVREMYGKVISETLSDRQPYEACDQSALVYLLVTERGRWGDKTFLESSYCLSGFWAYIVDRFEEMRWDSTTPPEPGRERWPLTTHFMGCKPCGGDDSTYDAAWCRRSMERALNFGDDQILNLYGFEHKTLNTTAVRRVRNDTGGPLDAADEELGRLLHPTFRAANL